METADRILPCLGCGKSFVFTAGEQAFYRSRGFENIPTRCADCRESRRREKVLLLRKAYEAVCAACGKGTTVPFRPRDGTGVLCRACLRDRLGR